MPAPASRPMTLRSSATEWLTAVRCAIGSSVVSVATRSVTATVVSRVLPPAPYVIETKLGPQRLQLADRLPEQLLALARLGREELEGERGRGRTDQLTDRRRCRVAREGSPRDTPADSTGCAMPRTGGPG